MKFISLFSGIGGFDLGFERANMTCAAQVEINPRCRSVLKRHFPNAQVFEDVCHVGRHNLPPADVVCGGFPCQDVSVSGRRKGLAGTRSGLWFECLRVLTEVTPEWVVIENVPGLLSSNRGRDFAVVLHGLVNLGYRVAWRVLDAQYWGVAQRRRRLFIVGHLGDGRAAEVLFESDGGERNTPPRRTAGEGAAGTLTSSPPSRRNGGSSPASGHFVAETLTTRQARNNHDQTWIVGTLAASGAGSPRPAGQANETDMLVLDPIVVKVDNTSSNGWGVLQDGTTHTLGGTQDVVAFKWNASVADGMTVGDDVTPTLRMTVGDDVTPTLRRGDHGGGELAISGSSHGVRRLTPLECERLQGFPDDWTAVDNVGAPLSDTARYQMLGNAVAVPVAEWIGKRMEAAS